MNAVLLTDIGELTTNDPYHGGPLGVMRDAALVVSDGRVSWIGPAASAPAADERRAMDGRAVLPAFVDSHTHLIFAGDRSAEFEARMAGSPYQGGGISITVARTIAASDDELRTLLGSRMAELRAMGTGTVEIKSGYGLSVEQEVRLLRLAAEATDETTLLAHVIPTADGPSDDVADRGAYVRLFCEQMLPRCATLARWLDVFCEPASPHAFDGDESRAILTAGRSAGFQLRVHGNQLAAGPGVQLACELGAASVDHCTHLEQADIDALAASDTVATLLPAAEFSTRASYPPARALLAAGATVALATDCNPGSSHTSSMPFVIALAVREMQMTPAEAVWAATAGAARSLRRDDVGVLRPGALARLTVLNAPSSVHLAYRPGMPIATVIDID
ncbi:MAG: hutI [Frankiales bacterium]|nr:hutI [Frankiales bacterium]